jgi:ATP-dependent helicase STH1/SNF2
MTQVLDIMQQFFEIKGIRNLRLDGSTKAEIRAQNIVDFNTKPDIKVFLLSTRAGGLGINLQSANSVIIFDTDWNPMMDLQAMARVHRFGQSDEVRVYRLISIKTVEEDILSKANDKKELDAKIIQAGQFNQKTSDQERQK